MRWFWLASATWLLFGADDGAFGQSRPVPLTELSVDMVAVKSGPKLLGAIVHRDESGKLLIAVRREWLRESSPKDFAKQIESETRRELSAREELRERVTAWAKEWPDEQRLQFLLKKQLERIDRELQRLDQGKPVPESSPRFLLIELAADQVERVFAQPPVRRQVALVAWREQLAKPESRSIAALSRELREKGIDVAKERVDLSDQLPTRPQSDAEWQVRRTLVEHAYVRSLDFQGHGDAVFRTGDGAEAPDVGQLLTSVLQGSLGADLSDLLEGVSKPQAKPAPGREKWMLSGIQTAEREKLHGFRVTRVMVDPQMTAASVETRFVAKLPNGRWETVWLHTESADATKPRPDSEKRIKQDPQIGKALDLLKAAGLANGDNPLQTAIQFGAATMEAQDAANARFFEFRERYLQRLDGPPLIWQANSGSK
jgi:hypothetical protein